VNLNLSRKEETLVSPISSKLCGGPEVGSVTFEKMHWPFICHSTSQDMDGVVVNELSGREGVIALEWLFVEGESGDVVRGKRCA